MFRKWKNEMIIWSKHMKILKKMLGCAFSDTRDGNLQFADVLLQFNVIPLTISSTYL